MQTISWEKSKELINSASQIAIANFSETNHFVNVDINDFSYCITWQKEDDDFIAFIDKKDNKSIKIVPEKGKIILVDIDGNAVELVLYVRKIWKFK